MDAHRQVSAAACAYLVSEMIQHFMARIRTAADLEITLHRTGQCVGAKVYELVSAREKSGRRESGIVEVLQFISITCWKCLFGKVADSLERSTDSETEFMIHDARPMTNRFISLPPSLGQLNCASYIAGIVAGMLACAQFPANVTAHSITANGDCVRTVFLVDVIDAH
mmetsp:Transcript_8368/g.21557  ORF Transcript_8368/g.21557 Transcript_8368/m.21557 type:complete len:168 (-) Transcript_8368:200-703(-)|eukprot:CAMPEP_0197414798 /NCGR_PEP_ID=MMETSP1170-20131217/1481_1 /TAXON_ID=54406 /ORGANISM="Sarcinochrysis sp, Strain CCMP770" /LENGTH=167 /DNA_ID=CAMNT_0042941549 /DNA_START=76 /DNA_END=579 /DNA_ORIENTATION=+